MLAAIATFVGSIIGAGILGIPYAVAQTGFGIGIILLISLTSATAILSLMLAELTLRTKKDHQMPGYSSLYLGPRVGSVIFLIDIISGYIVQLAYIIGLGVVLAALLGGRASYWSVFVFCIVSVFVYKGLETIKVIEFVMTIGIFIIVFVLAVILSPHISLMNFNYSDPTRIGLPYGVIMFALAGYITIPAVRRLLIGNEKKFPSVIIISYILVFSVYATFMYVVLGVTGHGTTEVATIGLGQKIGPLMVILGNVLALFTMSTCYLANGLALRRVFEFDYKKPRLLSTFLAVSPALILFVFGIRHFITILGIVGGIILGLQSAFIVLCYWRAQKHGDRKPEFKLGKLTKIGLTLLIIYIIGALLTLAES